MSTRKRPTLLSRRHAVLAWISLTVMVLWARALRAESHPTPVVAAVDSVQMVVSDADRAVAFYSKVLSFEKVSDIEVAGDEYERFYGTFGLRLRLVRMKLGDEAITLAEYLVPKGRPVPPDSRSNDRWFQHIAIITSDMEKAYQRLRDHKVEHASTGPQRLPDWNPKAAGIKAFYFKDPDGHPLEILEFPSGKGDPKWHQPSDRLFRGIDHTAIVVSDTDASLRFYRDLLGLAVVGESENYGTEQEHLNNVFGARLRITTLRAASGPGIELLEYLAPRDGRRLPRDANLNDLVRTRVELTVRDATGFESELRRAQSEFISPGFVRLSNREIQVTAGVTTQDRDGHILQFISK